ncbi:MAG: hypothetical protein J6A29_02990 [Clostridia bacterium]|nr:hypothetical protein [Clostridia bacterium]
MENVSMRVIQNIRLYVRIQRQEIWVRRDQLEVAEREFQRLKAEGKITSAEFRPEWSCNGSANFLMQYPD